MGKRPAWWAIDARFGALDRQTALGAAITRWNADIAPNPEQGRARGLEMGVRNCEVKEKRVNRFGPVP
jgi:hypothetical protein